MNYFVMDITGDRHQLRVPDSFTDEDFLRLLPRRDISPFIRLPMSSGEVRHFHVDSIVWFGRKTVAEQYLEDLGN